ALVLFLLHGDPPLRSAGAGAGDGGRTDVGTLLRRLPARRRRTGRVPAPGSGIHRGPDQAAAAGLVPEAVEVPPPQHRRRGLCRRRDRLHRACRAATGRHGWPRGPRLVSTKEARILQSSLFDLTGKIAVVSGASRGIGEAIAKLLAAHGAHVICSSRKADGCARVAEEIQAAGGKASAFACHVGEMDQIDALVEHVKNEHGRLDILVNNAAANPYFGHILDTDLGAFQKTVDVNIRGYFFMSAK